MLEVIRETNLMIQIDTLTDKQTDRQSDKGKSICRTPHPSPTHKCQRGKWEINILALDVLILELRESDVSLDEKKFSQHKKC